MYFYKAGTSIYIYTHAHIGGIIDRRRVSTYAARHIAASAPFRLLQGHVPAATTEAGCCVGHPQGHSGWACLHMSLEPAYLSVGTSVDQCRAAAVGGERSWKVAGPGKSEGWEAVFLDEACTDSADKLGSSEPTPTWIIRGRPLASRAGTCLVCTVPRLCGEAAHEGPIAVTATGYRRDAVTLLRTIEAFALAPLQLQWDCCPSHAHSAHRQDRRPAARGSPRRSGVCMHARTLAHLHSEPAEHLHGMEAYAKLHWGSPRPDNARGVFPAPATARLKQ